MMSKLVFFASNILKTSPGVPEFGEGKGDEDMSRSDWWHCCAAKPASTGVLYLTDTIAT